jgi:hypothetical protein
VSIEIDGDPQDKDAVLPWRKIVLRYEDGCEIHLWGETKEPENLPVIEGPEGKLFPGFKSDITGFRDKVEALPDPDPGITDFHQSVRERKKFALNEINGHRSTTLINIAKTALQVGRNLTFDPVNQVFTGEGADAANALINQAMRAEFNYGTAT